MKKITAMLMAFVMLFSMAAPVVNAQSVGDDFNTTVGTTTSNSSRTTAEAHDDINTMIGRLDFLGSSLAKRGLEFLLIYPLCFSTKGLSNNQMYANPSICRLRGQAGANITGQQNVGEVKVKDLMEGKFVIMHNAILLIIVLFLSLGVLLTLLMMKYTDEKGGTQSTGENGTQEGGSSPSSVVVGSGFFKGRVGGWLIEKLFGKDDVKKDGDEDKNNLSSWLYLIAFGCFLFFSSLLLAYGINGKINTEFDESFSGQGVLVGIGFIYILAFLAFLGIIMTLGKFSLIGFINMDLNKTEETSAPNKIGKLIALGIVLVGGTYFAFGWLITLVATVLKAV